ncbi:MAG: anti-sigma factor family protein [Myxococcota bacterium]
MDDFFARNRLSAYLDGELPSGEAKEVEAALARSPELREEYEQLRAAVDLLRRGGPIPAPAGFASRLEARLAKEPARKRWIPRVRVEVAMVAAAAVAVLVFAGRKPDEVAEAPAPAPQPVASAPPEPAPSPAPSPAPEPEVAAQPPATTDGALEEPKVAKKAAPKQRSSGVEKEAYAPEWEQADTTTASPNALFGAPAMRFRLVPARETGLKELAGVAAALGGRLTDEKGRPLAPYPMEAGESRVVRIEVPAYNAAEVEQKLAELGTVQLVTMGSTSNLYAKDATTSVTVEVRQP